MLDLTAIPDPILGVLRQRIASDQFDTSRDADIARLTPQEAFFEYCMWYGLVNWGDRLWDTVHTLKQADTTQPAGETHDPVSD